jgi:hypothetical protein
VILPPPFDSTENGLKLVLVLLTVEEAPSMIGMTKKSL